MNKFKNCFPEQLHFVQFHVTRGYFRSNKIPTKKYEHGYSEDYSKQLFETFLYLSISEKQNSTRIESKPSENKLLTTICTPEGMCFDPDDSGIHP
ncbi:hypothetical protein WA026_013633 [Henosepilachna vigintioctopunctata]|uniref:Uncharacterized protein n=1 Tax=Henosepilachna vigintioctopunctata TaxID=420089 RepID=A0AAW1UQL6_9CUCU